MNWPAPMPMPFPIAPMTLPLRSSFQELAILTARHPRIAMRIKMQGTNEVPPLHGSEEFPIAGIDNDSILLAISNPDVAGYRIHGEPVYRSNFPCPTLLPYHWLMNLPLLSRWMTRAAPKLLAGSSESVSLGLSSA